LDIKKTQTTTITRPGPSLDGIDHDEDVIYLALNPPIDVAIDPYSSPNAVTWAFTPDIDKTIITYVYVGQLNNPKTMPQGVRDLLASAGITEADYPDILAHDVLAGSNPNFDPQRFVSPSAGRTTFPYNPPLRKDDPVISTTFSISTTTTSTHTTATEDTYRVSLTLSADADFLDLAKVSVKDTASWSWSNKSSESAFSGSAESATTTIAGPSWGYSGPTQVEVLYDKIYRTFAFRFVQITDRQITLEGTLCNSDGIPVPGISLILRDERTSYRTYTDAHGRFRFIDVAGSPGEIRTEGRSELRLAVPAVSSPGTWQVNAGSCGGKRQ